MLTPLPPLTRRIEEGHVINTVYALAIAAATITTTDPLAIDRAKETAHQPA